MSIWLERFLLTVLAGILGATVLTNPWHLDRFQQITLIAAIIATSLFVGRTIEKMRGPARPTTTNPTSAAAVVPNPQAGNAQGQVPPLPEVRHEPIEQVAPAGDAEAAAEHYRRTSPRLKSEEIRAAYKDYCDRIAARFGLAAWAPVNQLTRMVTTNMGDTEAFAKADAEVPHAAWVAIRILVAFETTKERPMYMSYVFIGRAPNGEEIVALFDASREWTVLSSSRDPKANHEEIIVDTIRKQLQVLDERIAPDIRRLG